MPWGVTWKLLVPGRTWADGNTLRIFDNLCVEKYQFLVLSVELFFGLLAFMHQKPLMWWACYRWPDIFVGTLSTLILIAFRRVIGFFFLFRAICIRHQCSTYQNRNWGLQQMLGKGVQIEHFTAMLLFEGSAVTFWEYQRWASYWTLFLTSILVFSGPVHPFCDATKPTTLSNSTRRYGRWCVPLIFSTSSFFDMSGGHADS